MRVIRAMGGLLVVLCLVLGGLTEVRAQSSDVESLLWEGLKAETEGRPDEARDRYRAVLQKDPSNYQALVRLGQLGMKEKGGTKWDTKATEALGYLLRAAIEQPHRPEAYLLLAEFHYQRGYVPEGDRYMSTARALDPESREMFSLLGQRHENCLNFEGAAIAYSQALEQYPDDVYFLNRLYRAATQARTHDWVRERISDLELAYGEYRLWEFILSDEVLWKYYEPRDVRKRVYRHYYDNILGALRSVVDYAGDERPRYALPDVTFGYCPRASRPRDPYGADLYGAFIKASVSNNAEYEQVRSRLDEIRREALKEVARHNRPEEKAKALYEWLKKNVLQTYDKDQGILAEQVINNKKYLCLSGSILYTLIGLEAGLSVDGVIVPGHAYAVYRDAGGPIPVELTAGYTSPHPAVMGESRCELKVEEGFNVPWGKQLCQMARVKGDGGLVYGTNRRNVGPVAPKELTAYQFLNVRAYEANRVREGNHYKQLEETEKQLIGSLRATLSELMERMDPVRGRQDLMLPDKAQLLREVYGQYRERIKELQGKLQAVRHQKMKPVVDFDFRDGLTLVRKARGIAPLNEEFIFVVETIYVNKSALDIKAGRQALEERAREQRELQVESRMYEHVAERLRQIRDQVQQAQKPGAATGKAAVALADTKEIDEKLSEVMSKADQSKAKLRQAEQRLKDEWDQKKGLFLQSMGDLEKGSKEFPCSERILDMLKALCYTTTYYARLAEDETTLDEVSEVKRRHFPETNSRDRAARAVER